LTQELEKDRPLFSCSVSFRTVVLPASPVENVSSSLHLRTNHFVKLKISQIEELLMLQSLRSCWFLFLWLLMQSAYTYTSRCRFCD